MDGATSVSAKQQGTVDWSLYSSVCIILFSDDRSEDRHSSGRDSGRDSGSFGRGGRDGGRDSGRGGRDGGGYGGGRDGGSFRDGGSRERDGGGGRDGGSYGSGRGGGSSVGSGGFGGNEDTQSQPDTIFVQGLSTHITEEELCQHFGSIGIIKVIL